MAHTIIDRTLNDKRSSGNRQKFIRRAKKVIKQQINKHIIDNGNTDDLVSGKGKKITIPKKDLTQPTFNHGKGGKRTIVHPGNKHFDQGDRIDRQSGSNGKGGASKDGKGEDDFQFELTFDEFLDIFFEDCELPDLKDTVISKTEHFSYKRSGFSLDGIISRLNIERTMRTSKGRRIGLQRKHKKEKVQELEIKESQLSTYLAELESEDPKDEKKISELNKQLIEIQESLDTSRKKLRAVPYIDNSDLRYNRYEKVPVPTSQAVMFCLMDVSGSMGQWEKEMAKRYFMLLYLFLSRNYKRVEVVWIRHHSTATVVDEEEFFRSRESGGTIVSSALEKMVEVIQEKYSPDLWNIYGSQVSDGDNWGEDSHVAREILVREILPYCRYYTYIEVDIHKNVISDLWPIYETVTKQFQHFQMKLISDVSEIYPVFKQLFKKNRRTKRND